MGKRYYCDHCNRYLLNNRVNIKQHNVSTMHLRSKKDYYKAYNREIEGKPPNYYRGFPAEETFRIVKKPKLFILFDDSMPFELLKHKNELPPSLKPSSINEDFTQLPEWG
ncbi:hypothetical protein K502DRAFT_349275 [Neoconidiobolus thromboides FSU 785]|nr:hypothetical protein K502DRAFT_349275 [Neoconidiobolus thromboides FSU 785]